MYNTLNIGFVNVIVSMICQKIHCAMVGQGKGSHAFFLCEFDHVFDL